MNMTFRSYTQIIFILMWFHKSSFFALVISTHFIGLLLLACR
jgi:hypothetical protein